MPGWISFIFTNNSPWGGGSTGMTFGGATYSGYGTSGATHKNTKNATSPTNYDRFSNRLRQIVASSGAHPGMTLLGVSSYFANLVEYRILKIFDFLTFLSQSFSNSLILTNKSPLGGRSTAITFGGTIFSG